MNYKKEVKVFVFVVCIFLIAPSILNLNNNNSIDKNKIGESENHNLKSSATLTDGIAICTAWDEQRYAQLCNDGEGGAIITWTDDRSGQHDSDIYAQRIDSSGDVLWDSDGVALCTADNGQYNPQICSDGDNGAIITWSDGRNLGSTYYDIYAQRIDSAGDVQWANNGTIICTALKMQKNVQICSDGYGGAIIVWEDFRGTNNEIYAQIINSTGDVQWASDGVLICTAADDLVEPQIVSDGYGGAIIAWRNDEGTDDYVYAQRINSSGDVQWDSDGVAVCTGSNDQWYHQLCSDGYGGAIITWEDIRVGSDTDIYAQRINSTGDLNWTSDGIPICTADDDQSDPQICSNGNGGAIITWEDDRDINGDIYVQGINSTGDIQWVKNGTVICAEGNSQYIPQICSDDYGGAIITWGDFRNDPSYEDIYAQRINSTGHVNWTIDGELVCSGAVVPDSIQISSDEDGGAIIIWEDLRNDPIYEDIYAQRINSIGDLQWLVVTVAVGGNGGGGGGGDDGEEAIPGYNIFIIIGTLSLITVFVIKYKKRKI